MEKQHKKIITEGMIKKGGLNKQPTTAPVKPAAQSISNQNGSSTPSNSTSGNNSSSD